MKRRALLAAAGTALVGGAGCAAPLRGSETPPNTESTPTGESKSEPSETLPTFEPTEVQRQIFLEQVDDVPDDHPVSINVELLNGTVTAHDPATVRATVTNTADEEHRITRNEGDCALFDRAGGASETPGLHLHRPGFPGFAMACRDPPRDGNLWRFDLSSDERCAYQAYGCAPVSYGAGESQPETYQVWDDYQEPGYMPPGTYRFETEVSVGPRDNTQDFEWGFSVAVERPD